LLGNGDIFLTAHHADDNAETLLLNLMRGSGVDGLAGIPRQRKMGWGWVVRPLLDFRRCDLEKFLRERGIDWLEDPSNLDQNFDRNFLRNAIFPELEKRWPGAVLRMNQTASHARQLTTTVARLLAGHHGNLILDDFTLALHHLRILDTELQAVLLRQWVRDQDIITPPRRRLLEFLHQLKTCAAQGKQAELRWADCMIKQHGQVLWLHRMPAPGTCPARSWTGGAELDLGSEHGKLHVSGSPPAVPPGWEIGPRKEGAGMLLRESGGHRKLKELMRLCGIPSWLRESIPVLYWQGEVAALGDWLISARLRKQLAEQGASYRWEPHHPLLCKLQSVSVQSLQQAGSPNGQVTCSTT
jgi:tRNA(Ile)-lysidine synthase